MEEIEKMELEILKYNNLMSIAVEQIIRENNNIIPSVMIRKIKKEVKEHKVTSLYNMIKDGTIKVPYTDKLHAFSFYIDYKIKNEYVITLADKALFINYFERSTSMINSQYIRIREDYLIPTYKLVLKLDDPTIYKLASDHIERNRKNSVYKKEWVYNPAQKILTKNYNN